MRLLGLLTGLIICQQAICQDFQIIGDKYTFLAMENKSEGKIYVSFVISPTGQIYDDSVKAINSIDGIETIALESVRKAPDWKAPKNPTRPDGTTKFVLPVIFTLKQLTNKDWSEFHKIKGKRNFDNENLNEAILDLIKSIKLNKKNGEAYYILGQAFSRQNNSDDAKENFELARKYGFDGN